MYQIKNWTDEKLLKIQFCIKSVPICRKWSGGRRAQTPYYSSSGMIAILLYESLQINVYSNLMFFRYFV